MIRERLGLNETMKSPDLDFYNGYNGKGVYVVGRADAVESLRAFLLQHLTYVITRKQASDRWDKGLTIRDDVEARIASVDMGSIVGKLSKDEANVDAKESDETIVQVQRNQNLTEAPWLTMKITISGEYAV